jgi:hypothetical protein
MYSNYIEGSAVRAILRAIFSRCGLMGWLLVRGQAWQDAVREAQKSSISNGICA